MRQRGLPTGVVSQHVVRAVGKWPRQTVVIVDAAADDVSVTVGAARKVARLLGDLETYVSGQSTCAVLAPRSIDATWILNKAFELWIMIPQSMARSQLGQEFAPRPFTRSIDMITSP